MRGNTSTRGSLNLVFIWSYGILISILIATSISEQNNYKLYVPWEKITFFDTIILANAIAFSFFLPGYGLVAIIDKNHRLTSPLRLLLSYLVSILLVALPGYVGASLGYAISETEPFIISLYVGIFILFLFRHPSKEGSDFFRPWDTFRKGSLSRACNVLTNRTSEFVVLAGLFALVVFYTYYLNDGVIVVDQWFHHGRALLIGSELYKDTAPAEFYEDPYTDVGSDITQIYPPIFSSMLAGFFELSNSASVNAYVSIGFLNAMPVLAFNYFFTGWVPNRLKRASLLAAVLFVLSSGFGWVYAVDLAIVSPPGNEKDPKMSSVNIFAQASDITYDIGLPNTFINVGHPDVTTPLIIIALPAGFTLLGMMKEFAIKKGEEGEQPRITKAHANKGRILELAVSRARTYLLILGREPGTTMRALLLIIIVSFLGILSHDEFYLFIIIACVAILALLAVPPAKQSSETPKRACTRNLTMEYHVFFSSFLIAILLVALLDSFVSPAKYYVTREIGGVPLIFLCFIFVSSSWLIYTAIYVTRRRWNFFYTSSEKSDVSSKSGNTGLREIRTGFSDRRRFYCALSKMKKNITRPSKIKNLLSIANCSSPDTSDSVGGVSLGVRRTIRLALPRATVSLIAFLYLFTFLVWSQLSVEDIRFQADTENEWNIPWYLYPMKFGLTGLFGLAFLLSYLFKKFEREIFVFLIVAIVAFVSGPYYDEHRFGKYIMSGMACLAALLIYKIISGVLSFTPKLKHPIILGSRFNVVTGGILLGLVITFSSLSILMFTSFVEQVTNVADFNEDTRRDFPTHSEIQLLDFLNARLIAHKSDKNYNIALPENEVDNNRGFLTKLYGFTPIPRAKLLQTPLVLNASTIETFYNLLDYGGTKFIVIPKEDFYDGISSMSNLYTNDSIIQFALENFQRVFENDSYLVLGVPSLSPPSSKGDVALIYPKYELFSPALVSENDNNNNTITKLPFNTVWFSEIDKMKEFVKRESEQDPAVLYGNKDQRIVLWSDTLEVKDQRHVNYIEVALRTIVESNSSNDAGISWNIGNKEYTLSLRNDRLEMLATPTDVSNKGETPDNKLINVMDIQREKGAWYTFKIVVVDDIMNIYLDDLLAAQVPVEKHLSNAQISEQPDGDNISSTIANFDANIGSAVENPKANPIASHNVSISKVGLFSYNNIAEFKPIKLGEVFLESDKKEQTYYQHYYPLSMLALSKVDYNTFIEGDFSAFSKKYVIVPFDPPITNSKLSLYSSVESASSGEKLDESIYLDYVRSGGNLIVIDSANDSKPDDKTGIFSKLLSLSPTGNYAIFNSLSDTTSLRTLKSTTNNENHNDTGEQKQAAQGVKRGYGNMLDISGTVEKILYSEDNNTSVKSYYTTENKDHNNDNNNTQNAIVAPFVIEKKYGNGTITYVNAHGYFHAISNGPLSVSNNNGNPYPSSNRDHYFYTLANITNLVYPDLAWGDGRLSKRVLDNSVSDTGRGPGATKIRQILDDIQISSGHVTRINSSSLLLSIGNSSNSNLAAKEVTFKPSSPNSTSSLTVTNLSTKNIATHIDTNDWRHRDMASHSLQSNSITDEDPNYIYGFENAKIRNLKIYGSYEIIVESTTNSKPFFPAFPSISDYVAIGFPDGFDMTIKLSDIKPSYAEFEIIGDIHGGASTTSGNFQRLRVYGENTTENSTSVSGGVGLANITSNEIHFHNVRSDLASNGPASILMKSPQFQVKKEGAGAGGIHGPAKSGPQENTILTFKKDSPETEPIEVTNEEGRNNDSLVFRIDYIDSYNQPHREGVKKHYLSYIEEDIEAVQAKTNNNAIKTEPISDYQYSTKMTEKLKLPGDISERAKRQGVEVQWQKTMTSDSGLLLAASIIMTSIIATSIAAARMNSKP